MEGDEDEPATTARPSPALAGKAAAVVRCSPAPAAERDSPAREAMAAESPFPARDAALGTTTRASLAGAGRGAAGRASPACAGRRAPAAAARTTRPCGAPAQAGAGQAQAIPADALPQWIDDGSGQGRSVSAAALHQFIAVESGSGCPLGSGTGTDQSSKQVPAMSEVLLEELLEAVLFRIPPDDPASLLSVALVNKRWCRLICGPSFRRRFREFHGKPPLLGFVCQRFFSAQNHFFFPTSSFRPLHHGDRRNLLLPLHSYHSRVLLYSAPSDAGFIIKDLFVWDPITNKLRELPRWPLYSCPSSSRTGDWGNAAVLCAGTVAEGGCNNNIVDCHHGPFMVVFVGIHQRRTSICVYSSEADRWSEPIYADDQRYYQIKMGNSVVIGSAIYFNCRPCSTHEHTILKYDLLTQEISPIRIPRDGILEQISQQPILLLPMEDGRLGFACMPNWSTLSLWSRVEHGPDDEGAGWEQSRVIEPDATLIHKDYIEWAPVLAAFADTGAGRVIFFRSSNALFSLNLKSVSCKVVGDQGFGIHRIVPYVSFCTPAAMEGVYR